MDRPPLAGRAFGSPASENRLIPSGLGLPSLDVEGLDMGRVASLAIVLSSILAPAVAGAFVPLSRVNCEPGTAAAWKVLPSPYHIWHEGYSRISLEEIEEIMDLSANVWGSPCCSNFSAVYMGVTEDRQIGSSTENVISFIEKDWPSQYGHRHSTIAVTIPGIRDCEIQSADIVFNGDGFRFRTDGESTDLMAIAVHEFGHWIGLGHTSVRGATMLPYYRGGTNGREPNWDDQAGACYLYPTPCPCEADEECNDYEYCSAAGVCAGIPCDSKEECPAGSTCKDGACAPGCKYHSDCPAGDWCIDGSCIERFSDCTICRSCSSDSECGDPSKGYRCQNRPSGVCVKGCDTDLDCPGNSVCLPQFKVCGSPDASPAWPCAPGFECEFTPEGCSSAGEACSHPDGCGGPSDICVDVEGQSSCSCTCVVDQDCGEGAVCVRDPDSGRRVCYPEEAVEACGPFYCPPGLRCIPGETRCGVDHCEGVECPEGLVCRLGECVDPCDGVVCQAGLVCLDGTCVPAGPEGQGDGAPKKEKKKSSGCAAAGAESGGLALLASVIAALSLRLRRP